MTDYQAVLDYWFGVITNHPDYLQERNALWWQKNPKTDQHIAQEFGALHEKASANELDHWSDTPKGRLALIVLLDQFSRNMFREDAKSYAQDPKALSLALEAIDQQEDKELHFLERTFLYMPLEHSEDIDIQNQCVELFELQNNEADEGFKTVASYFLDYAKQHRDIIEKFGRFPHRNNILGRTSTPDEEAFLLQPNSSF